MDTINIDPLDVHTNEMLAAAINSVEVVKRHTGQPSFTAAHSQAVLAIFANLRELAKGTVYAGSSFEELPGGDPKSVSATNPRLHAMTAAIVGVTIPTSKPAEPVDIEQETANTVAAQFKARETEAANDAEAAKIAAQ